MLSLQNVWRTSESLMMIPVEEHLFVQQPLSISRDLSQLGNGVGSVEFNSDVDLCMSLSELSTGLTSGMVTFPTLASVISNNNRAHGLTISNTTNAAAAAGGTTSSAHLSQHVKPPNIVAYSSEYLLSVNVTSGRIDAYHLSSGERLGSQQLFPIASSRVIRIRGVTHAPISGRDGMFFVLSEEATVYAVLVTARTKNVNDRVRCSTALKWGHESVNQLVCFNGSSSGSSSMFSSATAVTKPHIVQLLCHNTQPLIVVCLSDGSMSVWSYERMFRTFCSSHSSTRSGVDDDNVDLNDAPQDHDEIAGGDHDVGDGDIPSATATATKRKQRKQPLVLQLQGLLPLPDKDTLQGFDNNLQLPETVLAVNNHNNANTEVSASSLISLSLSIDGLLLSVRITHQLVLLYDLSTLLALPLMATESQNVTANNIRSSAMTVSAFGGYSLRSPVGPSNSNSTDERMKIEYSLSSCVFHSHLPILMCVVSRQRLFDRREKDANVPLSLSLAPELRMLSLLSLTSNAVSSSSTSSSTSSTASATAFQRLLCVGAEEVPLPLTISELLSTHHLSSTASRSLSSLPSSQLVSLSNMSLDNIGICVPQQMHCSPSTGTICMLFASTERSSSDTTSGEQQDVGIDRMCLTMRLSPAWIDSMGFSLFLKPIVSPLSAPVTLPLFGLQSMSQQRVFSKSSNALANSVLLPGCDPKENVFLATCCQLKAPNGRLLGDNKSSNSTTKMLGFERLFAVQPLSLTSNGFADLAYDVLELDYLAKDSGSSASSHNDTNAHGQDDGFDEGHNSHNPNGQSNRKYHSLNVMQLARIPAIVSKSNIVSSIKQNYKWCKLDQEDFLMVPFPTVLDSLLISPSEDTKRFLMSVGTAGSAHAQSLTDSNCTFLPQSVKLWNQEGSSCTLFANGMLVIRGLIRRKALQHSQQQIVSNIHESLAHNLISDAQVPAVCLLSLTHLLEEDSQSKQMGSVSKSSVFLSFRDCVHWPNQSNLCLALSANGKKLITFSCLENKEHLQRKSVVSLPFKNECLRLWTPQENVLIFLEKQLDFADCALGAAGQAVSARRQSLASKYVSRQTASAFGENCDDFVTHATQSADIAVRFGSTKPEGDVFTLHLVPNLSSTWLVEGRDHDKTLAECSSLVLQSGEMVIDVTTQSLFNALTKQEQEQLPEIAEALRSLFFLNDNVASTSLANNDAFWVAIHTTRRVLICDSRLRIINAVEHSLTMQSNQRQGQNAKESMKKDSETSRLQWKFAHALSALTPSEPTTLQTPTAAAAAAVRGGRGQSIVISESIKDFVQGIHWVGSNLCLQSATGLVRVMLPVSARATSVTLTMKSTSTLSEWKAWSVMQRSVSQRGLRFDHSFDSLRKTSVFFTLPRNLSSTHCGSATASLFLTDRSFVFFYERAIGSKTREISALPVLCSAQRPINVLEPTALALLAVSAERRSAASLTSTSVQHCKSSPHFFHAMSALSLLYCPAQSERLRFTQRVKIPEFCMSQQLLSSIQEEVCFVLRQDPSASLASWMGLSRGTSAVTTSVGTESKLALKQLSALSLLWTESFSYSYGKHKAEMFATGRSVTASQHALLYRQANLMLALLRSWITEKGASRLLDVCEGKESFADSQMPLKDSETSHRFHSIAMALLSSSSVTISSTKMAFLIKLFDLATSFEQVLLLSAANKQAVGMTARGLKAIAEELSSKVSQLPFADYLLRLRKALNSKQRHDSRLEQEDQSFLLSLCPLQSSSSSVSLSSFMSLFVSSINNASRGKGLLSSLHGLYEQCEHIFAMEESSSELAKAVEEFQKSREAFTLTLAGTLGPMVSFASEGGANIDTTDLLLQSVLGWDMIEDYLLLSHQLEVLPPVSTSSMSLMGRAMDATDAMGGNKASTTNNEREFFAELPLPPSFVAAVGTGRENEKVVSYCRFSDAILSIHEDGFVSTSVPSTLVVFRDLSKYETSSWELFSHSQLSDVFDLYSVDYSSSNINAGEKHETQKLLCDLICTPPNSTSLSASLPRTKCLTLMAAFDGLALCGLRSFIPRGSPLDIGLYHIDPHRRRLTLEMTIALPTGNNTITSATKAYLKEYKEIVLAERRLLTDVHKTDNSILWKWFLSEDGLLCFSFTNQSQSSDERVLRSSYSVFNSRNDTNNISFKDRSDKGGDSDEFETTFVHFALIIDSSSSSIRVSKNDAAGGLSSFISSPISLAMFVDGEDVLSLSPQSANALTAAQVSALTPPEVTETSLAHSLVFLMPNVLLPYRLTEVRVWAMRRSSSELREHRELSLSLAEKRLRIAMNMKGARKLFGAFKSITIPRQSPVSGNAILLPKSQTESVPSVEGKDGAAKAILDGPKKTALLGSALAFPAKPTATAATATAAIPESSLQKDVPAPVASTSAPSSASVTAPVGGGGGGGARAKRLQAKQQQQQQPTEEQPATDFKPAPQISSITPEVRNVATQGSQGDSFDVQQQPSVVPSFQPPPLTRSSSMPTGPPPPVPRPPVVATSMTTNKIDSSVNESSPQVPTVLAPATVAQSSRPVPNATNASTVSNPVAADVLETAFLSEGFKTANILQGIVRTRTIHSPSAIAHVVPVASAEGKSIATWQLNLAFCDIDSEVSIPHMHFRSILLPTWMFKGTADQDVRPQVAISVRSKASNRFLLAFYVDKSISVFDMTNAIENSENNDIVKLVSIAVSTPVTFLEFLSPDLLFLVTHSDAFTWKASLGENGTAQKPLRCLQRCDLTDTSRWNERRVMDFAVSPDKWSMLHTASSSISCSLSSFLDSSVISLHNASSMKSVSLRAIGACFRSPGYVLILHVSPSSSMSNSAVDLHLSLLELESLLRFTNSSLCNASPDATTPAHRCAVEILSVSDEQRAAGMSTKWTLALGSLSTIEHRLQVRFAANLSLFGDRLFVLLADRTIASVALPPMPALSVGRLLGRIAVTQHPWTASADQIVAAQADTANRSNPGLLVVSSPTQPDGPEDTVVRLTRLHLKHLVFK